MINKKSKKILYYCSICLTIALFLTSCNNQNYATTVPHEETMDTTTESDVTTETPVVLGDIDYGKISVFANKVNHKPTNMTELVEYLNLYINELRSCSEIDMSIVFPNRIPEEKFSGIPYSYYYCGRHYLSEIASEDFYTFIEIKLENIDVEALAKSLEQLTRDPEIIAIKVPEHFHIDPT